LIDRTIACVTQPVQSDPLPSIDVLKKENTELRQLNRLLALKIEKLERQLWSPKSERYTPDEKQQTLFAEPEHAPAPEQKTVRTPKTSAIPRGPKPLDPSLPRTTIRVADPELKELICPESGKLMQPGWLEKIEVLARKPAEYYVKVYERMVFTSPLKTAPVYSPWPMDVLPRSRTHASVVAYLACAHFADHQPYHRIERQLERVGVDLPRNCQVSLMRQLDERMEPLVRQLQREVLGGGYVQLDATPIDLADPQRPGRLREATLWAYRSKSGPVWFDYQPNKSPKGPDLVLREADYRGILQTDGASGLGGIGPPGQVTHLGCLAHLRRPFFDAVKNNELRAERYLREINRLFRIDRLAKYFRLSAEKRQKLRAKHSLPLFRQLVARANEDTLTATPKTDFGDGVHYLLAQQVPLERCLTVPEAELSNNGAENSIRPLKLGAKNWQAIGHPSAGPRLANLFTLVENCRQAGIDPEAYLIDVIGRLPDHPAKDIAALSPWRWKRTAQAPASTTSSIGSS
jgi:transposase